MADSVFTKIVNGEIPAYTIYEDDQTLAFLDINPLTQGHTLVISKQQIDHLDDCPPRLYAAIFATVQKVSKQLKLALSPERIGLIVHGYEMPHAHVHVIPTYGVHEPAFPHPTQPAPSSEELAALAGRLKFG